MITYQNQDSNWHSPFFVNKNCTKIATIQQLGGHGLDREIYFSPCCGLRISHNDNRRGSCFHGWHIPTSGQIFEVNDGLIQNIISVDQTLSLAEYKTQLDSDIKHSIEEIYENHHQVYLAFGGGIDSTVLLSYIMHMGLGLRTHLVCAKNPSYLHPRTMAYDHDRANRMNDFFLAYGNRLASTRWFTQDMSHLIAMINQGRDYLDIISHATVAMIESHDRAAWVGGYFGNVTLLHHPAWMSQLRLLNPNQDNDLATRLRTTWQYLYCADEYNQHMDVAPVPLIHTALVEKPTINIAMNNHSHIYTPLCSDRLLNSVRKINPADLDFDLTFDARLARDLVNQYAPDLTSMIVQRTAYDCDTIAPELKLPVQDIDFDKLYIPQNLKHHPHGIDWLTQEIKRSQVSGYLPMNSMVSIKNLQSISNKINNCHGV